MNKLTSIALHMNIPSNTLNDLVAGHVPDSLAVRLKVKSSALQEFVDGTANSAVALLLHVNSDTVQELRDLIGRDGAIGLLIGLSMQSRK